MKALIGSESEPDDIAGRPEDSRRVFRQGQRVQDSEAALPDITLATMRIVEAPPGRRREGHGHGIHGEVTPAQVFLYRRGGDLGQGAGQAVAFASRACNVHAPEWRAVRGETALERRGAEGGVHHEVPARLLSQPSSERHAIAFDHEVESGHEGPGTQEEIPHEAAHDEDGLPLILAELAGHAQHPELALRRGAMETIEPGGQ